MSGDVHVRFCEGLGVKFPRATRLVVLCQTIKQAEEALTLVKQILGDELGLQLSHEKTKVTTYGKGYAFLGFGLSSSSRKMRPKSVEKFKDKVRELTPRKHNLDKKAIVKLNRVIRGTANYFAAEFSTNVALFERLDSWIRMRLRCMKFKRKRHSDNRRLRNKVFRKLGLLGMAEFCSGCQRAMRGSP